MMLPPWLPPALDKLAIFFRCLFLFGLGIL